QVIGLPVLAPDANANERTGKFTLTPDGTLTGSVDAIRNGAGGGELRNALKYSDDKERREALDKPTEIHYKLTAAQYAHMAGPLLLVRPRVVGSLAHAFDDKPRKVPIDLGSTGH